MDKQEQKDQLYLEVCLKKKNVEPTTKQYEQITKHMTQKKTQFSLQNGVCIYSNSFQAICSFYIFSLINDKNDEAFSNLFSQNKKNLQICMEKYNLNFQKNLNLEKAVQSTQNNISYNKILLKQASQGLSQNQFSKKIRKLAVKLPLLTYLCNKGKVQKLNSSSLQQKNVIIIGKKDNQAFLFIFSSQDTFYSPKKQKKSKSEGGQLEDIEQESNQFTWYQAMVLTIIILALFSHYFGIFDEQIKDYNERSSGKYYLIQFGQYIVSEISKAFIESIRS